MKNKVKVRVLRGNDLISQTEVISLRREKSEVKEVKVGQECGIGILNFSDFEENDKLEFYTLEEIADQ